MKNNVLVIIILLLFVSLSILQGNTIMILDQTLRVLEERVQENFMLTQGFRDRIEMLEDQQ